MLIALVASISSPCLAGNNPIAKAAMHVRAHNAKLGCDVGTMESCNDIITTEAGFSIDAFPVFYDLNEFLGVQYGLTWPAWTYSAAWNNCSDLVIGSISLPGDDAAHTWTACQSGIAVPSFVWLYADGPGQICIIDAANASPPGVYVLDCSEGLDTPIWAICAGVYGEVGDDPCEPATEAATWSAIKQIFK